MMLHHLELIFVHIARTGGTQHRDGADGSRLVAVIPPRPKHLSARQIRLRAGEERWNKYFKFSVVRNPWDRIVSMFATGLVDGRSSPVRRPGRVRCDFHANLAPHPHESYASSHYSDIINEKLDMIVRHEALQNGFDRVCARPSASRRSPWDARKRGRGSTTPSTITTSRASRSAICSRGTSRIMATRSTTPAVSIPSSCPRCARPPWRAARRRSRKPRKRSMMPPAPVMARPQIGGRRDQVVAAGKRPDVVGLKRASGPPGVRSSSFGASALPQVRQVDAGLTGASIHSS